MQYGMKVNTKCIAVKKNHENTNIRLEYEEREQVNSYKYLRNTVNKDIRCLKELSIQQKEEIVMWTYK